MGMVEKMIISLKGGTEKKEPVMRKGGRGKGKALDAFP